MATSVPVTHYRNEFVAGFEARQSTLRDTVSTESIVNGSQATFLIVNTGREATTRGPNGLIPAGVDNQSQVTVTLQELHDLVQRTKFNVFTDQGDQRRIMQMGGMAVINRAMDNDIITAMTAASVTAGAAAVITKAIVNLAVTKLGNAKVPNSERYAAITPAAWAYLSDITSFASQDYVTSRPVQDGMPKPGNMIQWMGVNWFVPEVDLPGQGTSSATMFMYHKSAIGHAIDRNSINVGGGYNDEQDYYWARHSLFHGAKLLMNAGVVKILHNDAALS